MEPSRSDPRLFRLSLRELLIVVAFVAIDRVNGEVVASGIDRGAVKDALPLPAGRVAVVRRPTGADFRSILNLLLSVVAAYLGGHYARFLYIRRVAEERK